MTETFTTILFVILAGVALVTLFMFGTSALEAIPKIIIGTVQLIGGAFIGAANAVVALGWYLVVIAFIFLMVGGVLAYFYWQKPGNISDYKPPTCTELLDRNGTIMDYICPTDQIRVWTPLDKIDVRLRTLVVMLEDDKFYDHAGFDLQEIVNAIEKDIRTKKLARGASTITQQLAKNLYLTRDKTFLRKASEIPLSLRMERELTKDQILELYLNTIEWGPGVYGIETASRLYFDHDASKMTTGEAWILALMIPNPTYLNPWVKKSALKRLLKRGYNLSIRLYQEHRLSKAEANDAFEEFKEFIEGWSKTKPTQKINKNRFYPVKWSLNSTSPLGRVFKVGEKSKMRISTTLDLEIQENLEKLSLVNTDPKACCALAILESSKIRAIIPVKTKNPENLETAKAWIEKQEDGKSLSAEIFPLSSLPKNKLIMQN